MTREFMFRRLSKWHYIVKFNTFTGSAHLYFCPPSGNSEYHVGTFSSLTKAYLYVKNFLRPNIPSNDDLPF